MSFSGTPVWTRLRLASEGDPTKPLKYVPGQGGDEKQVEPQVPVEELSDPLPLHPEEAGYDRMLEQVAVRLGSRHVPQRLRLRVGL